MKWLLLIVLFGSCIKQSQVRVIQRVKKVYSEDSINHPVLHSGFENCAVTFIKDSVFTEVDNNVNANPGYIYTKESPQELYYSNGQFFWAEDMDSVIYNKIQ